MNKLTSDYYLNKLAKDSSVQGIIQHSVETQQLLLHRLHICLDLYQQAIKQQKTTPLNKANRLLFDTGLEYSLIPYRSWLRLWAI